MLAARQYYEVCKERVPQVIAFSHNNVNVVSIMRIFSKELYS